MGMTPDPMYHFIDLEMPVKLSLLMFIYAVYTVTGNWLCGGTLTKTQTTRKRLRTNLRR